MVFSFPVHPWHMPTWLFSALKVDCWEYEFTWCILCCQGIMNPGSFSVHGITGIVEFEAQRQECPFLEFLDFHLSVQLWASIILWPEVSINKELEVGFGYVLLIHKSNVLLVIWKPSPMLPIIHWNDSIFSYLLG